jgi:hypothetical protein
MEKVVHLSEIFKTIFLFNFFEPGMVLFEAVKIGRKFEIILVSFEFRFGSNRV